LLSINWFPLSHMKYWNLSVFSRFERKQHCVYV
jgi:hypothetical protein